MPIFRKNPIPWFVLYDILYMHNPWGDQDPLRMRGFLEK